MMQERTLMHLGGLSAMMGAVITIIAIMMGPMGADSHNMAAVLEYFAANASRLQIHGLGVTIGKLLILGGFVALYASLRTGTAGAWARLGLAAAIVTTLINIIGPMMGGSVMPAVAQAYVAAPAAEAASALYAAQSIYFFYEALLGPTLISLAAALLPFAIAIRLADRYPVWLGWMALIVGIWLVIGGVAFFLVGPIGAAGIMNFFAPAFMLAIVWLFIVGVYLWRLARAAEEPAPTDKRPQTSTAD